MNSYCKANVLILLGLALSPPCQADLYSKSESPVRADLVERASQKIPLMQLQPGSTQQRLKLPAPADSEYGDSVLVDAIASDSTQALLQDLTALGMHSASSFGQIVSGRLPVTAVVEAGELPSLRELRLSRMLTNAGPVTSEGDVAQKSDNARIQHNVDGNGVTIGVISDSYNCLVGEQADKASGELPDSAYALEEIGECFGATDEGRALMHVIHDIAPAAELVFFSGSNGYANTANGILRLVEEIETDIIVDDTKFISAPFFQQGAVTQAVAEATRRGVVVVSSAGNFARSSYQADYNDSYDSKLNISAHDFDPGPATDIYQRFTLPEGESISVILQWDSPAWSVSGNRGSDVDLDLFIMNERHTAVLAESSYGNLNRDPIEYAAFYNEPGSGLTEFDLLISRASGLKPALLKYIVVGRFNGKFLEHATQSGTVWGHANLDSVITVGATNYLDTPAYGQAEPMLEYFSSAGGTPWLLDNQGLRLPQASLPDKPNITAPDNVNTPFFEGDDFDNDGNPNFRGTSASAPHAAGVAALILEVNRALLPVDVQHILEETAVDIRLRNEPERVPLAEKFDYDSGYGLIDAEAALKLAARYTPTQADNVSADSADQITVFDPDRSGGGSMDFTFLLIVLLALSLNCVRPAKCGLPNA